MARQSVAIKVKEIFRQTVIVLRELVNFCGAGCKSLWHRLLRRTLVLYMDVSKAESS